MLGNLQRPHISFLSFIFLLGRQLTLAATIFWCCSRFEASIVESPSTGEEVQDMNSFAAIAPSRIWIAFR